MVSHHISISKGYVLTYPSQQGICVLSKVCFCGKANHTGEKKCTGKVLETEREIELRFNSCGLLLWEGAELSVVRNWPLSL